MEELNAAYDLEPHQLDAKGRPSVFDMTTDEKLNEVLAIARSTQDLVEKFFDDLTNGKLNLPGPLGMFAKFMK